MLRGCWRPRCFRRSALANQRRRALDAPVFLRPGRQGSSTSPIWRFLPPNAGSQSGVDRRPRRTQAAIHFAGHERWRRTWVWCRLRNFRARFFFWTNRMAGWSPASRCGSRRKPAAVGLASATRSSRIRSSRTLHATGLILRVWFLDAQHGYAVGLQKSAFETHDGGRTWKPSRKPPSPRRILLTACIRTSPSPRQARHDRRGLRAAAQQVARRARRRRWPAGLDASGKALRRRQQPRLTLELDTRDGGATWKSGTAPLLGRVVERASQQETTGSLVFDYADSFEWPAEVYRLDLKTGKSESVFKKRPAGDGRGDFFRGAVARAFSPPWSHRADCGRRRFPAKCGCSRARIKKLGGDASRLPCCGAIPDAGGPGRRASVGRDRHRHDSAAVDSR